VSDFLFVLSHSPKDIKQTKLVEVLEIGFRTRVQFPPGPPKETSAKLEMRSDFAGEMVRKNETDFLKRGIRISAAQEGAGGMRGGFLGLSVRPFACKNLEKSFC